MKTLINKNTTIPSGTDEPVTYFALFKVALEARPAQGFTTQEMRRRIRVLNALDENREKFDLEDADFAVLKECFKDMTWGLVSKDIVEAEDYLNT